MKKSLIALSIIGLLILPVVSSAITIPATPLGGKTIETIVTAVLDVVWKVVVVLAVIMMIAAGMMFMTASGEAEKVKTARQTVMWAIVGIAVAVLAFSLTTILTGVF